ncbi:Hydroxylamine reductase [bioreactor metagenome]|uniref:Hydroxylamine reductase n=1 Tax=bioreactor metagenome TaxID=1076179 RepID=A0A644YA39_9ZZZZ
MGVRSISIPETPYGVGEGYPPFKSGYWDPIFKACADRNIVLSLHIGGGISLVKRAEGFDLDDMMILTPLISTIAATDVMLSGAIKKFVVMGGCDGRSKSRDYYTEFAKALPKDTVILTAGCAKYKYIKLNLGDIGGIPRVLDAGQCNDSYSLALIALKLKEVFGLDDINDLPIAYNIAWYEQKAVIVLLALLYLGVKNIHLGPTLPAFLSPNVANVLVENFGIAGISSVEDDLKVLVG